MSMLGCLHLPAGCQALQPKLADRLQQPKARLSTLLLCPLQQALIQQGRDPVQDVCRDVTKRSADGFHCRKLAAPHKDGESAEQALLLWSEQAIAPLKRVAQRLLPCRYIASLTRQGGQSMLQSCQQGLRREQVEASRCQLDGQGQPVETSTNLCNGTCIGAGQLKIGRNRLRPLQEKCHCRIVR